MNGGHHGSEVSDVADCVIRRALTTEIADLGDLRRRASLSNDGDRDVLLAHPDALEFAGEGVAEGRTRVATVDGRIVGFSTILDADDIVELEDLFVDPTWMRKGIGLELVRDVLDGASDRGARCVEVTANPHAMAFYAHAGFLPAGHAQTRFGPAARLRIELDRQ